MRWQGRRQSSNIEDRRGGASPASYGGGGPGMRLPTGNVGRAGGGGLLFLIVAGLLMWLVGGMNPMQVIAMLSGGGAVGGSMTGGTVNGGGTDAGSDQMKAFVATVLAETEDTWTKLFAANNATYREPYLVLFTGQVRSACGFASAASGPFYCPGDQKVYLDMAFFQELARRFGAPGDFAQAYVVAHEIGHHVQNQIGILSRANQLKARLDQASANRVSVQVELQADCFAGIWAHYADQDGLLERGDVEEALQAAAAVGDDTIQRRAQGYVVPETFSHGSAQQRQTWFMTGLKSGDLRSCDTFNAPAL